MQNGIKDIIFHIVYNIERDEFIRLTQTNTFYKIIAESNEIWLILLICDFNINTKNIRAKPKDEYLTLYELNKCVVKTGLKYIYLDTKTGTTFSISVKRSESIEKHIYMMYTNMSLPFFLRKFIMNMLTKYSWKQVFLYLTDEVLISDTFDIHLSITKF